MTIEQNKSQISSQFWISLVIGLALILPLLIIAVQTYVVPTINSAQTAKTNWNLLRDPEIIGQDNYIQIAEDTRFSEATNYTLSLVLARIGAVILIPPLIGILIGVQGTVGRILNRILLSVVGAVIFPVSLALLWVAHWGQIWGREPSPWGPDNPYLMNSIEGAQNAIITLDAVITLCIALAVGGVAYIAVMRGRQSGTWKTLQAGLGIWVIGILIAAGSALLTFDLPFLMTRGGPANSTTTIVLNLYQEGFQFLKLGYASAKATLVTPIFLIIAFLIWLAAVGFRLRIQFTAAPDTPNGRSWLSLLSIPLIIAIAYPLLGLIFWGQWLAGTYEGFERANELADWGQALSMSISPWRTIWLIHIPITFCAGLALGFFRPLGRIGSNIIFLVLLFLTFIPVETLMFEWFAQARDLELLNTPDILNMPWMVSGIALLVFKLFFDGAYDKYHVALSEQEKFSGDQFLRQVLLPSLPIAVLVGVVMSFVSIQPMLWSLITGNSQEVFTLPVLQTRMMDQMRIETAGTAASAVTTITTIGIPFMIAFALLNVFVLDRLAILGGKSDITTTRIDHEEDISDDQVVDQIVDSVEPKDESNLPEIEPPE